MHGSRSLDRGPLKRPHVLTHNKNPFQGSNTFYDNGKANGFSNSPLIPGSLQQYSLQNTPYLSKNNKLVNLPNPILPQCRSEFNTVN